MIPMFWTKALVALAFGTCVLWMCAWLHEKGVRPLRDLGRFFGSQPAAGRVLLVAFAAVAGLFAGAKPGFSPDTSLQTRVGLDGGADAGAKPDSVAQAASSTNAARTLTAEDFARGLVLTRVGTGEAFDFAAPPGATVCARWEARGAATDWFCLSFTNRAFRVGERAVSRFRVFSFGQVGLHADQPYTSLQTRVGTGGDSPADSAGRDVPAAPRLWPLCAPLGVVPRVNWPRIAGNARATAEEELAPSRFWHFMTPSNTLQMTWQNVLLGRRADAPLSFQLELWPSGRFVCRYDLSRLDADEVTNVLVGASIGSLAWTTNSLPADVTSLAFHPLAAEDAHDPDRDGDGLPTVDEIFVTA